ncbi:aminotransferase class V-fold PLP-dependent enzyme [Pseudalkalibacillus caeni]|uniref:cysteine desulfurase n=1 Tax=Exobacillus caeni TaxID=2574798 RepID=A0A5R9EYK1_9BACL|nr:aminotransferase class V-fold PLP-dependent enzyme [Pseudalkalibacillus caeni]TLS35140.1 aminotransferase class V-fold PLP-dependent enzyme [Pseudalkalibacillus caeni]
MIYFDNAASSFPKPPAVSEAVMEAITEYGANPGRSGHALATRAGNVINQTRKKLAGLFGLSDPNHVVFANNATAALNQGIKGFPFTKGDHVLTTSYEHNSVRRPLEALKREKGIAVSYFKPEQNGDFDIGQFEKEILPETRMIIASHASNLTGMILPIEEIGELAKKRNIRFLVDASQSAGILPIHMEKMHIDLLAFPGHKGLLGPQGTGALLIGGTIDLNPLIHGGTGGASEEIGQPDEMPARFESGTLNTPGIAGLSAGIDEVNRLGIRQIFGHEWELTKRFMDGLDIIGGITYYGPEKNVERTSVVPFTIEGIDSHEIAIILDQHYQMAVRAGLHCSPIGHESIGTIEKGAVRVSFGLYNTTEEVEKLLQAIEEIKIGYLG